MGRYVVSLLFDKNDTSKVLMSLKVDGPFKGKYNGIDGRVMETEGTVDAVVRLVKDVAGCDTLRLPELICEDKDAGNKVFYYAVSVDGDAVTQKSSSEMLVWVPTRTVCDHTYFFAYFPKVRELIDSAVGTIGVRHNKDVEKRDFSWLYKAYADTYGEEYLGPIPSQLDVLTMDEALKKAPDLLLLMHESQLS